MDGRKRKTSLLFVMNHLHCGGAERALVSLLGVLDYGRYEVDLLLFKREGMFLASLPPEVRVLEEPAAYRLFDMKIERALGRALRAGRPDHALARLMAGAIIRTEPVPARSDQRIWRYMAWCLPSPEKRYDCAIGFLERGPIYYVLDKVRADRKIGWIHTDYDRHGMDPAFDDPYFAKLDHLVTVSEECAAVLKTRFPRHREKIRVIRNIVSPAAVRRLAEAETGDLYGRREGETIIVSVGRLHPQKGFDLAIDACALLVEQGRKVRWFVIGEGDERERLEKRIRERGLEGRFVLLGAKANPYPYMRQADLYVQPSRTEGRSIAVDEAKMLGLPILVTDYPTAGSQIVHEKNGLIAAMEPEAIADGLMRLMDDPALREQLVRNLALEPLGTEDEVRKFDALTGAFGGGEGDGPAAIAEAAGAFEAAGTGTAAGATGLPAAEIKPASGEPPVPEGAAGPSGSGAAVLTEGSGGR
ncbi:MAG: glycosyl transferase [Thermobacillus sp. ZCTH02-B1]|uniref:glycosyltransferase n=1 Tax=Thermobacillus sp. ZCTH02-B1 TaxID=1858795 RepID=UPI000B576C00|nr:glycosyltransferase [Thermobacillus sp. ZCTH02-B1]OUM95721.1 MAG: glycosyl transferase [Thermobacillus sp. ZCTH02-B1]